MSRVAELATSGRSSVAKFHELRLKYWNRDLDVVCCFEGSDDVEFYLPHVRQSLSLGRERIDFVNCGGKGVVLTLWEWAGQRSWNLARLGFFVDKDLDDYLKGNKSGLQLYLTDYYSIESHVLDPDFFDNVWQDSFRLSVMDARRNVWRDRYYAGAIFLSRTIFPLIYTALAVKRSGGSVDFDRVKLDEFFFIGPDGLIARKKKKLSFSYSDVFPGAAPSMIALRASRKDLASINCREWVRGKFLLWYAMIFLSRMKATLGSRMQPNRAIVKDVFSSETAVGCLSSRKSEPSSLSTFLASWLLLIAANGLAPVGSST